MNPEPPAREPRGKPAGPPREPAGRRRDAGLDLTQLDPDDPDRLILEDEEP